MRFDETANLAAVQAAALVNALADDRLDVDGARRLLPVVEGLDADAAEGLRGLAGRLAEVFASADPAAEVNRLLLDVQVVPRVTDHDDRGPHLHFEPPGADAVSRVEANTLMGLAVLLCGEHRRLGTCAARGCDRVWVDTSRNARRRFCSTACANRTHVAASRARRSGTRA